MIDQTQLPAGPFPAEPLEHGEIAIAGIRLRSIGDEPVYFGGAAYLQKKHARAARAAAKGIKLAEPRGKDDRRMVCLQLGGPPGGLLHPRYDFLVDNALLARVTAEAADKGDDLSQDELLVLALKNTAGAVAPDFSADAINAINRSYYASSIAFSEEAGLATMFVANRPLNELLGGLLAAKTGKETVHIKELCSGNRTGHWRWIAAGAQRHGAPRLDVTLTDFVVPEIAPELEAAGLDVSAEEYSLFDDLLPLPDAGRLDAIIATYGFDSVWLPEDVRLLRLGDDWYESLYRVQVDDWNPRRADLLAALRAGRPLPDATPQDYEALFVEEAQRPVDINAHPYAEYLRQLPDVRVSNFPGGLIKRVVQAFERQLAPDGVFISVDTGNFGVRDVYNMPASLCSGLGAHYKMENYSLAKAVLQGRHQLDVSFLQFAGLARHYLPADWDRQASAADMQDIYDRDGTTMVMVVTRRQDGQQEG